MITLPSSPLIIPVGNRKDKEQDYPMVIVFNTVAGTIELSLDGGLSYFTPTLDPSATNQKAVVVKAPITHIKLTGNAGTDAYAIR